LPFITKKVIERESESGKIPSFTYFKMGDAIYSQYNQYDSNKSSYIPAQNPDKRTIEALTSTWIMERVKEAGGVNPRELYDLKNRVARQKRKVENMLNPKMEDGGMMYGEPSNNFENELWNDLSNMYEVGGTTESHEDLEDKIMKQQFGHE